MMTLKAARLAAGLTQAQLGARVQADQTSISRLEAGRAGLTSTHLLVQRICREVRQPWTAIREFLLPEDRRRGAR